jgi:type IV secretory pathway TrbD component
MSEHGRQFNVIHQSLVRPILLAGAERPLAIANWITSAALILGGGQWYTAALGVVLATAGHWALVQMAAVDPQFSRVCIRQYRYQERYPARASVWASPLGRIRPTVPAPREMRG